MPPTNIFQLVRAVVLLIDVAAALPPGARAPVLDSAARTLARAEALGGCPRRLARLRALITGLGLAEVA